MYKYRLKMNLQLFSDEMPATETGVDIVPAAEEQQTAQVDSSSETGANTEVAAEPEKINNFEKAFAKRLAAEREKWQSEVSEKYKDYELHKELSAWAQERTGADALTLKEQIEMDRLQERAEQQGITPEMQKRLEALEQKAALADQLEHQRNEEQRVQTYFSSLNDFMKDKVGESEKLNQFMIENGLTYDPNNPEKSFGVAYKAMRAEQLEQELATARETAVKEYLSSKTAPRVEGSGAPGIVQEDTSKMDWKDIRSKSLARIQAATQST